MPSLNTGNAILSNPIKVDSSYNVGIGGAASGSFKLQVTGTAAFTSTINMTGTNAQILQTTSNSVAGNYVGTFYNSNANSYGLYIAGGNSSSNNALYITDSTRTNTLFTVLGDGKVGIGNLAPSYTLDVTGTSRVTGAATFSSSVTAGASIGVSNSSTIANNNFYLLNSSTNKLWNIVNIGSGVSGRVGNFEINNNAIDIFAITQTGAVGIGITSPSRKLHVYGSTSGVFEGILVENGASNAYAIYQSKTGNSNLWQFGTWNDNSFRIGTSGVGDFLNITSAGRIGIGTDIPASNMQLGRVFGFIQDINSGYITANRGTNENYIVSQYAVRIHLDSAIGEINFDTAPSGTAGTYATLSNRLKIKDDGRTWIGGAISGLSGSGVLLQVNGQTRLGGTTILHNGSNVAQEVRLSCNGAASFFIDGALSKNSGSFRIDHPLESMTETHQLVHSFVEAPQADLYYRGKLNLVNGKAQANIDEVATMTEGTFEALCREVQCFTTNETGWDLVKGKVIGNIIYIESQNANSTDEISWLVIGERKDKHMMDTFWTDDNGRVIVEPLKPIQEQDSNNK